MNIIIEDFYLDELYRDYEIDTSIPGVTNLDFIHTENQGRTQGSGGGAEQLAH